MSESGAARRVLRAMLSETKETLMRLLMMAFLLAAPLAAQTPVPSYEVKRAPSKVTIDGKLDDKAWEAAAPIQLIFPWDSQTGPKQKTTVRLLWDDDFLYVSYDCEDHDITAQYLERDDPTYQDDAVEIFINPKPSQTGIYMGLEMNARATLYDYLMYDSSYAFKRFNMQGVQLGTLIRGTLNMRGDQDQGWSLEVAIPWVNFEELSKRPTPGAVWSFNLARWDGVGRDRRLSVWSDPQLTRPGPHAPARFGRMVFVGDAQ
jgi:hypothetical protein